MARLYAWGANNYGQLGVGDTVDKLQPVEVPIESESPSRRPSVDWIAAGGGHTLVSIDGGTRVLACGLNDRGQLGIGRDDKQLPSLSTVLLPADVRLITAACGWDFSLAVSGAGQLWAWGSNSFGQLGLELAAGSGKYYRRPVQVPVDSADEQHVSIIQVAAGIRHSVVLTESGSVYVCGANRKGQLGLPRDDSMHSTASSDPAQGSSGSCCGSASCLFRKVPLPNQAGRIAQVAAGETHTAAVTESGQIIVWGSDKHGLLPTTDHVASICGPSFISVREPVAGCASGWSHVAALTGSGKVYTWGRATYGQLGRAVPSKQDATAFDPVPTELCIENAANVVCGAEHTLVLSSDGKLYGFGFNDHGMCCTGDTTNQLLPYQIEFFKRINMTVVDLTSGSSHVLALVACKSMHEMPT